jgi:ubiquinone/menaquinone biosynthesis C-methylase UbiE
LNRLVHMHKCFPERLSFLLYNPIRQRLNPPERLISKLGVGDKDTVIDFGCGPGFYTIPLARIKSRTIGIDISAKMLKQARQHAKKAGVRVELMQSEGISIGLEDESVDLVILVHVFHETEDKDHVLREFFRLLKSSGRLIIVERTRANSFLGRKFGPPVIEQGDVIHAITKVGFAVIDLVQHGEDSVFIAGTKR